MELIKTIEQLRTELQAGVVVEHTTIPVYLVALYSLRGDANARVRDVIHHVLMEEMLHLTLVANLINAIGGKPNLCQKTLMVPFPAPLLPGNNFKVNLSAFSKSTVHDFLQIEKPAPAADQPKGKGRRTIGDFYDCMRDSLKLLHEQHGDTLFSAPSNPQVTGKFYYGPGEIVPVTNLETALFALKTIRDQGEGDSHTIWEREPNYRFKGSLEPAHYYRFKQLLDERSWRLHDDPAKLPTGPGVTVSWNDVYPMKRNPKIEHYDGELKEGALKFNKRYGELLCLLNETFNGKPEKMGVAIPMMSQLRDLAIAVIRQPYPGKKGFNAGPTFEPVDQPCGCSALAKGAVAVK
ncbi:MAG: hypothetical protein DKT66_06485 [Candidatus Melainabacteria bacterium]|nr:MAG: hypothetical protein DKT66_06485 [Candidatus Melainabacteria bacterium]